MNSAQQNVCNPVENAITKCVPRFLIDEEVLTNKNEKVTIKEVRFDNRIGGYKYLAWRKFDGLLIHESNLKMLN